MIRSGSRVLAILTVTAVGCASIGSYSSVRLPEAEDLKEETNAKPAKTLLEWSVPAKNKDDQEGRDSSGNGNSQEQDRLDPDRPHLPEAASTVGRGRVVLESGYTYTANGNSFIQHSYPEALLRIGMFADWFELRIGQNFLDLASTSAGGEKSSAHGAQDLSLGVKLGLTEQKEFMPEAAVILQATIPTGNRGVSNNTVLPGINLDLGWVIIKDLFGMEALFSANGARDDARHTYVNYVQSINGKLELTPKLDAFAEYNLFVPAGAVAPEATHPQHYVVGGFVYFLTNDLEVDIRAGVGLNEHANDYLLGAGFAARY